MQMNQSRRFRWRRASALTVLVVVAMGSTAPRAGAHASLASSDPGDGSVLADSPTEIRLDFTEPVQVRADGITLFAPGCREIPTAITRGANDREVIIEPPELDSGAHLVSWAVISADGHPVSGAIAFTIEGAERGPVPSCGVSTATQPALDRIGWLARWAEFGGLIVLVGALIERARAQRRGVATPYTSGLMRCAVIAAAAGALLRIALVGAELASGRVSDLFTTAAWTEGLQTRTGVAALVRVGLVVTIARLVPIRRRELEEHVTAAPDVVRRGATLVAALGTTIALGWGAHPTTGRAPAIGWALDVIHVVAGSAWVGGLTALALAARRSPLATARVEAFSTTAAAAVVALAGSGVAQAFRQLATWSDVTTTNYGRWMLAKVAIVVVMLGLGTRHRRALRRSGKVLDGRAWRIGLTAEAALGIAVVAVTAALVASTPTRVGAESTTTEPIVVVARDEIEVTVRLDPGSVGANTIGVEFSDLTGGQLSPLEARVVLRSQAVAAEPITVVLAPPAPESSRWFADLVVPFPGAWEIEVIALLTDVEQARVPLHLEI